ncbi:MAG TPA: SUF system Fe-S cluster assembly regulator [Burkholderiaceae bacterium]|nr:SUF system Fe-S cluster assembly regulator [Burkholderiaceae bacterium]
MLRISRLTDYGTLVMSQMAAAPEQVFSAGDLASRLGLGAAAVSKILKGLARHGLVGSVRGRRGGYALTRPPQGITLADIVDALEEQPFGLTECSARTGLCELEESCRIRANWRRISDTVRSSLEAVTLAEMLQPVRLSAPISLHRPGRAAAAPPVPPPAR